MEKRKKKFLWENKNEDERGGKRETGIQMKGSREREEGEENEEDGEVRIR